jgi:hypothetical protein
MMEIDMNTAVTCSSCGGTRDLHFVTCGIAGSDIPGRTLVYCSDCRSDRHHMIDVSLPISLLTPDLFASLYSVGKTQSDPEVAVGLAFGKLDLDLVARVQGILSKNQPERATPEEPQTSSSTNNTTTLEACGFVRIGEWALADYTSTKHLAHIPGIAYAIRSAVDASSFVYAFAVDEEVVYVGESAQPMGTRFQSYRYGNPVQADTDNRVKIHITKALQQGSEVSIWCFSLHVNVDFGGEQLQISLSKPIEELLIRRLHPVLNNKK